MRNFAYCLFALLFGWNIASPTVYSQPLFETAVPVAVIIDDMGYNLELGQRALDLPGHISYSFLPGAPHTLHLAEAAHRRGKQVLLHLPMHGQRSDIVEPDALSADMNYELFHRLLQKHLQAVPFFSGVNNHMGSTVTSELHAMNWLMQELAGKELFFVDSRTTHLTVAEESAKRFNVPFARRDVFLDNIKTESAIENAFNRVVRLAQERNKVIAIAHPHPVTLSVLEKLLPKLESMQLVLVQTSELTYPKLITRLAASNSRQNISPENAIRPESANSQ